MHHVEIKDDQTVGSIFVVHVMFTLLAIVGLGRWNCEKEREYAKRKIKIFLILFQFNLTFCCICALSNI